MNYIGFNYSYFTFRSIFDSIESVYEFLSVLIWECSEYIQNCRTILNAAEYSTPSQNILEYSRSFQNIADQFKTDSKIGMFPNIL